jgi:acetyltransferase-like isoleucine patch superfamily enzyme
MRNLARQLFFLVFLIAVLPLVVFCRAGYGFQGCSQLLSLIPGWLGKQLRKPFYHLLLTAASRQCHIDFGTIFPSRNVCIGNNVYIGANCIIAEANIGDDVLIGSGVHLLSKGTHDFSRLDLPIRLQGGTSEPVTIGEDSWLGNGAIVMADVGRKCIVGAGSVVTRAIPDYAIAVGNPARVVRMRNAAKTEVKSHGASDV